MLEQRNYLITHAEFVEAVVDVVARRLRRLADELEEAVGPETEAMRVRKLKNQMAARLTRAADIVRS